MLALRAKAEKGGGPVCVPASPGSLFFRYVKKKVVHPKNQEREGGSGNMLALRAKAERG
jgi:hypothetical protein